MNPSTTPFDFRTRVLEKSQEVPVLVDFWAPWCGPCRILGPILDDLAEGTTEWVLVKVNTEEETELARQYQIQSIPHVKLFVQGEIRAEFSGALSRTAIQNWLDTHLPDPCRDTWARLKSQLPAWPDEQRSDMLDTMEEACRAEEWIVARAAMELFERPGVALDMLPNLAPGHPVERLVESVREVARLALADGHAGASASLRLAAQSFRNRQMEECLQALIRSLAEDRYQMDELPRKALVGLFALLTEEHPLTRQYRPWFAMALN